MNLEIFVVATKWFEGKPSKIKKLLLVFDISHERNKILYTKVL